MFNRKEKNQIENALSAIRRLNIEVYGKNHEYPTFRQQFEKLNQVVQMMAKHLGIEYFYEEEPEKFTPRKVTEGFRKAKKQK